MKTLYLIRHAKSSWDDLDLNDVERPLNERGKKDAPRIGKRLKEKNIFPDVMLSSPAKRAFETCRIIAKILGYPDEKIKTDKRLYHANQDQLLKVVQEIEDLNDIEESVFIFGHNPGLTDFANSFLCQTIDNIPTCGVIGCKVRVKHWNETTFGSGEMVFFDFPKNKIS
jgi:phosphohistidine phosphatase